MRLVRICTRCCVFVRKIGRRTWGTSHVYTGVEAQVRGCHLATGTGSDVCSAATMTAQEETFVLYRDLPCRLWPLNYKTEPIPKLVQQELFNYYYNYHFPLINSFVNETRR